MTSDDFESALGKFRSDAAAEVLRQAIRDLETKFDPNQPRAPVGSSNGGQWVDTGRGGSGAGKVRRPLKAGPRPKARPLARMVGFLASHPEAAPIIQAAGLPALTGGVALARALGDFDERTTGREKTPFLKLPSPKLRLSITAEDGDDHTSAPRYRRRFLDPAEKARIEEECEELKKNDYIQCQTFAAMYGRTKKAKATIWKICETSLMERQNQCRLEGGVSAVTSILYTGRR
ncbi:hypothetical protein [Caulobacter sp. DWR1-3-2b1]|uniref:hypothetical protein n=1 Tax=Caulobacter sp. DWR1-3-2b1 TaxID=2804670 RepID=UPI003CF9FFA4